MDFMRMEQKYAKVKNHTNNFPKRMFISMPELLRVKG